MSHVEIVNEVTVVGTEEVVHVISEGLIGPPGRNGRDGSSSLFSATASVPLGGHRAVLMNGDSELAYASCDTLSHMGRIIGITFAAASQGQVAEVMGYGLMEESSWNWDTSKPVFLSTNGTLTQVEPVAPASKFSMVVGFPISSTALFVNLREPIQLT
jgi:hypothetical protein